MKMSDKRLFLGALLLLIIAAGVGGWLRWFGKTKVGFLNYQVINLGEIVKSNTNPFIQIGEISLDHLEALSDYDMVFINAMGLRITEEQRSFIKSVARDGLPIFTVSATNPDNYVCSVDSSAQTILKGYLTNGGRTNYKNMLEYVRKNIDKKIYSVSDPERVVPASDNMIYHADPDHPQREPLGFNTVSEYEHFLKVKGIWKENAPHILITGQMGEPADLIKHLEDTGNMVYPIRSMQQFVEWHQIDSVAPAAIINMAHGRMGNYIVDYLKRQNIPLFCPLNVNRLTDEWEKDKMGMSGGFLSQSIVTPELDGGLRPYVLFGNYKDKDGLQHTYAIPERLKTFVQTVNNYIELKRKPNAEKRIAIYYYKGPGQNALTAAGMEVVPSLYNLLVRLRDEGYRVDHLPDSSEELGKLLQKQGSVFNLYAEGAFDKFMKEGNPELITRAQYEGWVHQSIRPEKYKEVIEASGDFPGQYMTTSDGRLGVARLQFGNVVLLPQNAAGSGTNAFKIIHGTHMAPPHTYIASYLWTRYAFKADALIHFGTHGSLEFTPEKQVALSASDWPDCLVGSMPHFYIYSIGNVGEGIIAKRRSYAGLQSYLTPPFMQSNVRGEYRKLTEAIKNYNNLLAESASKPQLDEASLKVKRLAVRLNMNKELELDSTLTVPYTEDEVSKIENFSEELANTQITGKLYTLGEPYEPDRIRSSVYAMTVEPLAYGMLALDKMNGRTGGDTEKHQTVFSHQYLEPSKKIVTRLMDYPQDATDGMICRLAHISMRQLQEARRIVFQQKNPQNVMSRMMQMQAVAQAQPKKAGMDTSSALWMKQMASKMHVKRFNKDDVYRANAICEIERAVKNVTAYRKALLNSPQAELNSLLNALDGGYTQPSPGGDPIANPNTLPTGRNLYSINAEATPSEGAWDKGVRLAQNTIDMYKKRHHDSIPRKVSYTLWSGEFIETEGATVAQVLYMLGVEPVRDVFGRVSDLRLIPSEELGRPRIDVVVQTSGQLRDLAASRLFLISRAVEMAAASKNDVYDNLVAQGVVETERTLIEKGVTPKDARRMSTYRVFGGMNGNYGTGITGMVESGDKWESEQEIADVYLNNMGTYYVSKDNWEEFRKFVFEAALTRTDAVVQPRQSNTWGALSLDHVYEFMGGLNLAVRSVTGKDPDAYLSDYRNRNHVRMQEVKEAIGVESRTTLFNPEYIREKMKGGASSAAVLADIIRNTYGWNVMKPKAIDRHIWDQIYQVYVTDKFALGTRNYFEKNNPAALQEITAVMMEAARKGMWKADDSQLKNLAALHTELVNQYAPGCSQFVCNNAKLQDFIASRTDQKSASTYRKQIEKVRQGEQLVSAKGVVMKKEELNERSTPETQNRLSNTLTGSAVALVVIIILLIMLYRKKKMKS